jgi:hypothetical protein
MVRSGMCKGAEAMFGKEICCYQSAAHPSHLQGGIIKNLTVTFEIKVGTYVSSAWTTAVTLKLYYTFSNAISTLSFQPAFLIAGEFGTELQGGQTTTSPLDLAAAKYCGEGWIAEL